MDEARLAKFLAAVAAATEDAVLGQELSMDEMEANAGGIKNPPKDYDCTSYEYRKIYEGGFPNCAATVEKDSWCGTNDACYGSAIAYLGMKACGRAWN